MNIKKWKKGAMLFMVLLFPSLVYVILSSGDHSFNSRHIYGPKTIDKAGDTNYYSIPEFQLDLCNGKKFLSSQQSDNIFLISFFNPNDSLASSRINGQLMTMQDRFRDNSDVTIFTIATDTAKESRRMLCSFENAFPIKEGKWIFGTLSDRTCEEFALNQLFVDDSTKSEVGFNSNKVVLVDKKGRIRAFRDGLQYVGIKALADDVKVIKAEEFIPKKKKSEGK
ncbi:MAG: hypothetical protein ACPGEG_01505 [Salibacteraceae bacterium]